MKTKLSVRADGELDQFLETSLGAKLKLNLSHLCRPVPEWRLRWMQSGLQQRQFSRQEEQSGTFGTHWVTASVSPKARGIFSEFLNNSVSCAG